MRRSPELRPTALDGLVALAVILLAAGLAFFQWRGGQAEGLTAIVSVDGAEVDRFPPEDLLEGPRTYASNGYALEVVSGGDASGLRVALSDCPTQDCVHTGAITRSGQSIVCLPARIIIRLEGGPAEPGDVDAVLG